MAGKPRNEHAAPGLFMRSQTNKKRMFRTCENQQGTWATKENTTVQTKGVEKKYSKT
jgi:hypothetical protein